jgi:hypothetical protein
MTSYARQAWQLFEPVHAVTYFSPEPLTAFNEAGYRGFWMGYFAGRSAPLGAVGPNVIEQLFYNFSHERVARALPAAWDFAPPETALAARLTGSAATLRRCWGTLELEPANNLLHRAAEAAPPQDADLFAANLALPWPTDPVESVWHATTLLREHRGDGHVNALREAGISGRESHVFHAFAAGLPRELYRGARDFGDEEWAEVVDALEGRRLLSGNGLTDRGRALKDQIEQRTDEFAAAAFAVLHESERVELLASLLPLAQAVVRSGDLPLETPIGLDLSKLVEDQGTARG